MVELLHIIFIFICFAIYNFFIPLPTKQDVIEWWLRKKIGQIYELRLSKEDELEMMIRLQEKMYGIKRRNNDQSDETSGG